MILSQIKLLSLGHCFVHLPRAFIENETKCKVGSIIKITSVQDDERDLFVIWNGKRTSNDETHIDIGFAEANGFKDETIVLNMDSSLLEPKECSICRVQLLESTQLEIINEHLSTNLLDRCRVVYKNLIIPIWLSDHVRVFVKVISAQPTGNPVLLGQWTEMQIQDTPKESKPTKTEQNSDYLIEEPIPIISHSLGIDSLPKFQNGNMLIQGPRGSGKTYLLRKICNNYHNYKSQIFNCKQLRGKRIENINKIFDELLNNLLENQPSILCLDDIDAIVRHDPKSNEQKDQDSLYKKRLIDSFCRLLKRPERSAHVDVGINKVLIVCTCQSLELLDHRISLSEARNYFIVSIKLYEPNKEERIKIIKSLIEQQITFTKLELDDCELDRIASDCKSYMPSDLRILVERAIINSCSRDQLEFSSDPVHLKGTDFTNAISNYVPANLRNVTLKPRTSRFFSDIGGMEEIKRDLETTILLPLKYPTLYQSSPIKPQTSILLYGPPGCGKTMLAEALTNHEKLNSICIRGPELLSKYIGSSEAAVRDLFKKAHLAKPCIIFFDEFESLVPKRGSDSTGVTDRVVNQFLTLMDGFEQMSNQVFILAASSRPDMIDPAILRPGRIDKHIHCSYPSYRDRIGILQVLSRRLSIREFDSFIDKLAKSLDGFTGADIHSLLYSAQVRALNDNVRQGKRDIVILEKHLWESLESSKKKDMNLV